MYKTQSMNTLETSVQASKYERIIIHSFNSRLYDKCQQWNVFKMKQIFVTIIYISQKNLSYASSAEENVRWTTKLEPTTYI